MSKNKKGEGSSLSLNQNSNHLSAKSTQSIVNIYIPDHMLGSCSDGFLVGYHFDNTHYVVSSIIPANTNDSIDKLSVLIRSTPKLHAFNRYCVSDPKIIGSIEDIQLKNDNNPVRQQQQRPDVVKYKQLNSNNAWL